jgi:hypothetical protein
MFYIAQFKIRILLVCDRTVPAYQTILRHIPEDSDLTSFEIDLIMSGKNRIYA